MYRKIYERHYGSIPKDEDGRTYDIHHIDGNRKNNDLSNLVALSIEEHYKVHLEQGDYNSCLRIIARKNVSPELLSELAKKHAAKNVKEGKCVFKNEDFIEKHKKIMKTKMLNGNHPSQTKKHRKMMSEIAKEHNVKRACFWEIITPDGDIQIIKNLNQFCKSLGLSNGNMSRVASGELSHYKGYLCKKIKGP